MEAIEVKPILYTKKGREGWRVELEMQTEYVYNTQTVPRWYLL